MNKLLLDGILGYWVKAGQVVSAHFVLTCIPLKFCTDLRAYKYHYQADNCSPYSIKFYLTNARFQLHSGIMSDAVALQLTFTFLVI